MLNKDTQEVEINYELKPRQQREIVKNEETGDEKVIVKQLHCSCRRSQSRMLFLLLRTQ